jgi:hypothetical protein
MLESGIPTYTVHFQPVSVPLYILNLREYNYGFGWSIFNTDHIENGGTHIQYQYGAKP